MCCTTGLNVDEVVVTGDEQSDDQIHEMMDSGADAHSANYACATLDGEADPIVDWMAADDDDEYPPLALNYEALRHIATCYLPGNHGKCTEIETLTSGSFHEIRVLNFEDGWTCIGRFTRNPDEQVCVTESEFATVKYVREHTHIPVPETYFVNFDPTHAVGAQFVLMERIPGASLYSIWEDLSTKHKLAAMDQIADVLAQLSGLKFDQIGSINMHGSIGPLQTLSLAEQGVVRGPFDTMEEYMFSFIAEGSALSPDMEPMYAEIRTRLHKDIEDQDDDGLYNPPFRLIHGDFDGQNMLFTWPDHSQPPKLSGVIDWDFSYTGPQYYLYEYPIFIQDVDWSKEKYELNKILRKNFVRMIAQKFPKGSDEREDAREAFRQKTYAYNTFRNVFINSLFSCVEEERYRVNHYLDAIRGIGESCTAYSGRDDYESDSELESDDE